MHLFLKRFGATGFALAYISVAALFSFGLDWVALDAHPADNPTVLHFLDQLVLVSITAVALYFLLSAVLRKHRGEKKRHARTLKAYGELFRAHPHPMCLVDPANRRQDWEVLGTDVSHSVVNQASRGLFSARALDSIPREYLKRYWLRGIGRSEGMILAKPKLRDRVHFRVANLNDRLPGSLGQFDVAFLRNVLIYFSTDSKRRLILHVLERIKPGGLLMVGHSESLFGQDLPLTQLAPAVYRKTH